MIIYAIEHESELENIYFVEELFATRLSAEKRMAELIQAPNMDEESYRITEWLVNE